MGATGAAAACPSLSGGTPELCHQQRTSCGTVLMELLIRSEGHDRGMIPTILGLVKSPSKSPIGGTRAVLRIGPFKLL